MNLQFFTWLEVQSLCQPASVGGQHGRGGNKNPHRHGAHRYKPMGVTETQRGEPYGHPIVLLLQTQCQEKSGASTQSRRKRGGPHGGVEKKTPIDPMPMGATYESGMNTIETDRLLCKKGVLRCLLLCLLKEYHPIVPQILWKAHYMLSPLALSLF